MRDAYRQSIAEESLASARKKHVSTKPGFNRGIYFTHKFDDCWRAFDAYLNSEYPSNSVQDRLDSFKVKYQLWFKQNYSTFSDGFQSAIKTLSEYAILDMRHKPRDSISLSDVTSLDQLIEVIYRIRCNLDHGGKLMSEEKNIILVENAAFVLFELMERIMSDFEKK